MVFVGQVVAQDRERAEVDVALGQHTEDHGIPARQAARRHSTKSLVFAHAESLQAAVEHRRAARAQVQPSLLDLDQVSDDSRHGAAFGSSDRVQSTQELVVRNVPEIHQFPFFIPSV